MNYLVCCLLIFLIPGLYVSVNKYFLYSPYPSCRHFLIRTFFLAPLVMVIGGVFSMLIYFLPLMIILGDAAQEPKTLIGVFVIDLIFIFLLRKYVLPREEPEIFSRDSCDYDYFVYRPVKNISNSKLNGTRFERVYKKRLPGQPPIERQLSTLILSNSEVKGKQIVMLISGEIAVTQSCLETFTEHSVTGCTTTPVKISYAKTHFFSPEKEKNLKTKDEYGHEWFQLLSESVLPPLNSRTNLVVKDKLFWESNVIDSKFYYDQDMSRAACDINQTAEYFGSTENEYRLRPQRYWVFSKRLKELLIQKFGAREPDFVPVRLVDENGNIIDQSKKSGTS